MKYYGIKTPVIDGHESYIWWISNTRFDSWYSFFSSPGPEGESKPHRLPISEGIKAYESIGYRCVELEVKEVINKEEVIHHSV